MCCLVRTINQIFQKDICHDFIMNTLEKCRQDESILLCEFYLTGSVQGISDKVILHVDPVLFNFKKTIELEEGT